MPAVLLDSEVPGVELWLSRRREAQAEFRVLPGARAPRTRRARQPFPAEEVRDPDGDVARIEGANDRERASARGGPVRQVRAACRLARLRQAYRHRAKRTGISFRYDSVRDRVLNTFS